MKKEIKTQAVYLDHAATTKAFPEVNQTVFHYHEELFGNASSVHSIGEKAKEALCDARKKVAECLGISQDTLYFTPSGTISNYLGVIGHLRKGEKIITCVTEHPSVLYQIKKQKSNPYTILPVDNKGRISLKDLERELEENTCLLSIMQVNNETGTEHELEEIGQCIKKKSPNTIFYVDGAQGFGKRSIDLNKMNIDAYSISAHKVNGHTGTGALYIKNLEYFNPVILGGMQEKGVCPGTENIAGISGFARACEITFQNMEKEVCHIKQLNRLLRESLKSFPYDVEINSPEEGSPYILNVLLKGQDSKKIVDQLSERQIYISSRSACHCAYPMPSYVLRAMGRTEEEAFSSIRISLGHGSEKQDINRLMVGLRQCYEYKRMKRGI